MSNLVFALSVFILSHLIPAMPGLRARLIGTFGRTPYLVGYSSISILALIWIVVAYSGAPYLPVWDYDPIRNWVPVLLMPLASILLVAGLVRPNPLSLLPRAKGFDAERPGVLAVVRHPIPWAFVLWAVAHMVPNGDAASLVMFAFYAMLSLVGTLGLDAKARRTLGEETWRRLAGRTSFWPCEALIRGRARLAPSRGDLIAVAGGLVLYAVLLHLHEVVIGVPPWPPIP